ncbi:hypothetical protein AAG906_030833 [Vitis piasezkii]
MCGGDDHLAWKRPIALEISTSLSYSWTTLLLCVDLFFPVQISISSMLSLCHTLSRASCFIGLIGSYFHEIRHGSTDELPHDSLPPPPPPPLNQAVPQASPYLLHDQSEVVPTTTLHITVPKDTHAHMDLIEKHIRQLRVIPMATLPAKFKMPDIERRVTDDHHVSFISEWCNPTWFASLEFS